MSDSFMLPWSAKLGWFVVGAIVGSAVALASVWAWWRPTPAPVKLEKAYALTTTGAMKVLKPVRHWPAPGNAAQLVYAAKSDLLFLRNSGSSVWVVDARNGHTLGLQLAHGKFTSMDLAPDESSLFVADYGGTKVGYGQARDVSHVHRYDLTGRQWEQRLAPKIAFLLRAVDAQRFLLLEQDQWVALSLNHWESTGTGIRELARCRFGYAGGLTFDPRLGRVYHATEGISSPEIHVATVDGEAIRGGDAAGVRGVPQPGGGGSAVLATDGRLFYYGKLQIEALDVTHRLRTFPEAILAASADIAFGKTGYYHVTTGDRLGDLGFETSVYALTGDGTRLWAYDPATTTLHEYRLEPR